MVFQSTMYLSSNPLPRTDRIRCSMTLRGLGLLLLELALLLLELLALAVDVAVAASQRVIEGDGRLGPRLDDVRRADAISWGCRGRAVHSPSSSLVAAVEA